MAKKTRMKKRDKGRKILLAESSEPKVDGVLLTASEQFRAFDFYRLSNVQPKEMKKWVVTYAEVSDEFNKADIKLLKAVNEKHYLHPLTAFCRMLNRGWEAPENTEATVISSIRQLTKVKSDVDAAPTPAQERAKAMQKGREEARRKDQEKGREYCGEIEYALDFMLANNWKLPELNVAARLKEVDNSDLVLKFVSNHIEQLLTEFTVAKANKDDDFFAESYADYYKNDMITKVIRFLDKQLAEVNKLIDSRKKYKAAGKVRKTRAKDPMKLVKNMKFHPDSNIKPLIIISSKNLVVFNDKYRTIGIYRALDSDGLTVKGSKIQNWSDTKSTFKKIKPKFMDEVVKGLTDAKNVSDIIAYFKDNKDKFGKTDAVPNGTININTQLIKVC